MRSPWPGVLLPEDVHLQAPPNLSDDLAPLLMAGIDDWGGVSPVTVDHVNPERPWPGARSSPRVTEALGFTLAPRLTIYPELALDPRRWLHDGLQFAVMDRSDAEGLARDDPGVGVPGASLAAQQVHRASATAPRWCRSEIAPPSGTRGRPWPPERCSEAAPSGAHDRPRCARAPHGPVAEVLAGVRPVRSWARTRS